MEFHEFYKLPILGILRGIEKHMIKPIVDVCISSGLKAIEITMNTENAPELIKNMVKYSNGQIIVGAGTVLSMCDLEKAINSGAKFIVMPTIIEDVILFCVKNNIPVFPGALTPNEILKAWKMGASMVKVFPSSMFGPKYFKEIKSPLNKIKLMVCGGVNTDTISEYFLNGASAAAFGASIFKTEWLQNNEYGMIEEKIKELIIAYNDHK
ncbi:bifunctional 4-hydroxy-2-oxoglutarate aldolase/2-dehydro-3-deoxy-phosphogluconate aldolase [Bacteroidota bacterium]